MPSRRRRRCASSSAPPSSVAVHGPDQPALGGHPQAPPVRARPGRPDPRARRLRGARRPPDALRPHLPDRDAGRSEYRPDQLARDVRQGQQVRLHRDAIPVWSRTARCSPRPRWKYLSAMEEEKPGGGAGRCAARQRRVASRSELVSVRPAIAAISAWCKPEDVTAIDVSPKQLVSVAAALIPFLENDDANRALMGSEHAAPGGAADPAPMPRWSAPGWRPRSRMTAVPPSSPAGAGIVDQIDGARIVVRAIHARTAPPAGVDIYRLRKFMRSNQSTCINQRPLVRVGDQVSARATSSPTGRPPSSASWRSAATCCAPSCRGTATTSRTAILISERIARDDVFTSIHIEEFEVMGARHQARPGGDHPRHPECRRGIAEESGRGRHRLYRCRGESGRHPRRQGDA